MQATALSPGVCYASSCTVTRLVQYVCQAVVMSRHYWHCSTAVCAYASRSIAAVRPSATISCSFDHVSSSPWHSHHSSDALTFGLRSKLLYSSRSICRSWHSQWSMRLPGLPTFSSHSCLATWAIARLEQRRLVSDQHNAQPADLQRWLCELGDTAFAST